jgi:hypothetical protein
VNAAKEDVLHVLLRGGVLSKLEAIAGEIGVLDDLVPLIVMPQDRQLTNAGSSSSGSGFRASAGHVSGSEYSTSSSA